MQFQYQALAEVQSFVVPFNWFNEISIPVFTGDEFDPVLTSDLFETLGFSSSVISAPVLSWQQPTQQPLPFYELDDTSWYPINDRLRFTANSIVVPTIQYLLTQQPLPDIELDVMDFLLPNFSFDDTPPVPHNGNPRRFYYPRRRFL